MKYRVVAKEIYIQTYTVEANSKAHAKNQVVQAKTKGGYVRPDPQSLQHWGVVGPETWEVIELG